MRVYLDSCALSRPFDDLSNSTVRMECEAVLAILDTCVGGDEWLAEVLYEQKPYEC